MDMVALDAIKLITDNVHHVFHQRFKQTTTHIVVILIHLLMHIDPYLVSPLQCQTHDLLIRIFGVLIYMDPINLVINGIFAVLENVAETWGKSTVLVPVVYISIVFIAGTSFRTYGKA